ncbi:MAG: fumarate hydratase, partial [Firmicutes bacterium]|nr:fumarate hydratase [Bacillota bacterium]
MREVHVNQITEAVAKLSVETNLFLREDVCRRIAQCREEEDWPVAGEILGKIEDNIRIAREEFVPMCQDTGMACVFLEVGQDVHLTGGSLEDAVNEGVRKGYTEGYLRKAVVADPIRRGNTGDNTPAHIHTEIVPGDRVKVIVAPKGFGSENMSRIRMFPPSAGAEGVKDFIVRCVDEAGANPCPPVVVGVGIGGTFDRAALMAKQALLVPLEEPHPDEYYAAMEEELLERINE